jgi:hypothetical protein
MSSGNPCISNLTHGPRSPEE